MKGSCLKRYLRRCFNFVKVIVTLVMVVVIFVVIVTVLITFKIKEFMVEVIKESG